MYALFKPYTWLRRSCNLFKTSRKKIDLGVLAFLKIYIPPASLRFKRKGGSRLERIGYRDNSASLEGWGYGGVDFGWILEGVI